MSKMEQPEKPSAQAEGKTNSLAPEQMTAPAAKQPESRSFNPLFPVFLKLENLDLLLVGGGYVALEKLSALLANSPQARIRLVATEISRDVKDIVIKHGIPYEERAFRPGDLEGIDLVIIAINDKAASTAIHACCKEKRILTNVADKPQYCDFYLSSIVQKGNLKIAISTNGKSPTIAKRVKEVLNDTFPDEIENVLDNMEKIRNTLKGDFSDKVRQLNHITRVLAPEKKRYRKPLLSILLYAGAAVFFMFAGYFILSYILK
ncbi:siroheme synthase-like protein [Arcticibacter tournemirensis]|nr:bifunctional precorrin-2 dehydrogenase/sirohydrochlorin ferrochelatase [Arcticibacter tournemirensis]TQM46846.1 siroheme synthase-like protein [Arcticibacter tournemirensis]